MTKVTSKHCLLGTPTGVIMIEPKSETVLVVDKLLRVLGVREPRKNHIATIRVTVETVSQEDLTKARHVQEVA